MIVNRRNLIGLFVLDVVLWVIASAAFNGDTTGDNVVWTVVFVVLAAFVVLGIFTLVRSLRSRAH